MKATTLVSMMEQEQYQSLTCAEFAAIIRKADVLEDDGIPEFLKEGFTPTKVTHYTNKEALDERIIR